LVLKLSSLPKCKALTPLWHLVRIFGCDRVRLRKPSGPEAHLSTFYAICRDFPGAEHPAVRDLEQVCYILLQWTSREEEVAGRAELPPMPTCLPAPSVVLVRHMCAFVEALSRDAKPIWMKQYVALRTHFTALAAHSRNIEQAPRVDNRRREQRGEQRSRDDDRARKKKYSRSGPTSISAWLLQPRIQQAVMVLLVLTWLVANFLL